MRSLIILYSVLATIVNGATLLPKSTASLNQLFREEVNVPPEIPVSDNIQLLTGSSSSGALESALSKQSIAISKQREITVVGKGISHAEADTAIVHCEARAQNENSAKAKQALDESVNSLLADMSELGIPKENITHLDLKIEKRYNWKDGKQIFLYYEGFQPFEISVPLSPSSTEKSGGNTRANLLLEGVVDRLLVASSADFEMTHISLKVTDPSTYISAARQQAVQNAIDAAKEVAAALDMTIGLPAKVHLHQDDGNIRPQPRIALKSYAVLAADSEASASPVANRKLAFEASVEVTFDIYGPAVQQCHSQSDRLLDIRYTR